MSSIRLGEQTMFAGNKYLVQIQMQQKINFTENLDQEGNAAILFVHEAKETIFDFLEETVKSF